MSDYIVRATAAEGQLRIFSVRSTELVEEARRRHQTSPVATAALGRVLSAGVMMGSMMKNQTDILTMQIKCSGKIGGLTVTADSQGHVKGYVNYPAVMLPPKNHKLDVGGAVGDGFLTVTKDMGLKDPYCGQVALQTGEIGDDITYYFAVSEQIPSSVGLGVLMNGDNRVQCAGGFIVQVMPFAEEATIAGLEENIRAISSVTALLEEGMTPEELAETVCKGFVVDRKDTMPVEFSCDCSRKRVEKALLSVGKEELQEMIRESKPIEVKCHFCNTTYTLSVEELKTLWQAAKERREGI